VQNYIQKTHHANIFYLFFEKKPNRLIIKTFIFGQSIRLSKISWLR
jgi:hypothetical protein